MDFSSLLLLFLYQFNDPSANSTHDHAQWNSNSPTITASTNWNLAQLFTVDWSTCSVLLQQRRRMQFVVICLFALLVSSAAFRVPRFSSLRRSSTLLKNMIECQVDQFDINVIQQSSSAPVVVDFYAEWCGPCKLVGPIFQALADELTDIKFVKKSTNFYFSQWSDVCEVDSFNIQGLPLFGIFRNGKMVASHSGALSKDNLRNFINENINNMGP